MNTKDTTQKDRYHHDEHVHYCPKVSDCLAEGSKNQSRVHDNHVEAEWRRVPQKKVSKCEDCCVPIIATDCSDVDVPGV
jgi:hypothetical protein